VKKFMDNLDKNLLEKLAEAAHEIFYEDLIIKGHKYGQVTQESKKEHSLLKPYAELSEDEKESNRNNVRDIPNKLASVGYATVLARGSETPGKFQNDEIEKLAKMEHERWMQEKLDTGWQYAKKTNRAAKLHKSLIPWEKLSEGEKEKDRSLVKGIPKILAKAGYTMVKLIKKN
jgi:exonuclease VII large subunit